MDAHDCEFRLWNEIGELHTRFTVDRLELGCRFLQLRNLYSERANSGGDRRSGHGIFEREIRARGFKPRTVRTWIGDYLASETGAPTEAEKRAKRRKSQKRRQPSIDDFVDYVSGGIPVAADAIGVFARLLPYRAARLAYHEAAKLLHPDRGGSVEKMQVLNLAWRAAEEVYRALEQAAPAQPAAPISVGVTVQ